MKAKAPTDAGSTEEWSPSNFDHLSEEFGSNFTSTLDRLRTTCPVAHSDQYGGFWVVTRYRDVFHVAQDWATFSSAHGLTVPVAPISIRNLPVEVDPPIQRVYKRLLSPYLTPSAVAPWEDKTRALADALIDRFIDAGRCDFMEEFARPFPALSFFDFALNADPEDVDRVAYMASKATLPDDPEAAACWIGLAKWIEDFIATRRNTSRRDDVVDGILNAEIDGRPITDEEIIGLVQLLILGGLETTAGALGMAMIRMCESPDIPQRLREQPSIIPSAVEEFLRVDPPFVGISRTVMKDTEIDGHAIRAGEKVTIYFASANRDSEEFDDPECFDPLRTNNRHLSFGAGPHRCAGSNLARMNLRIAFEQLLARLRDLRLDPDQQIHFHQAMNRAPKQVPILFDAP